MNCSKCGKNIVNDDGTTMEGVSIEVVNLCSDPEKKESYFNFLRLQLGKYFQSEDKPYVGHFCFECFIDSLMGVRFDILDDDEDPLDNYYDELEDYYDDDDYGYDENYHEEHEEWDES